MNKAELEERLIAFAAHVIEFTSELKKTEAAKVLTGQLIKSGTSPALNYGESRSAESRKDFIHKLQLVLKELRETHVNLKIVKRAKLHKTQEKVEYLLDECNQLISIFVKSVQTIRNCDRSNDRVTNYDGPTDRTTDL